MTCLLCGKPLGEAKLVTKFHSKRTGRAYPLHVVCEQLILNEPWVELNPFTWIEYGLRSIPPKDPEPPYTLAELQEWNFKLNQGLARTQAQDLLRS